MGAYLPFSFVSSNSFITSAAGIALSRSCLLANTSMGIPASASSSRSDCSSSAASSVRLEEDGRAEGKRARQSQQRHCRRRSRARDGKQGRRRPAKEKCRLPPPYRLSAESIM